MRRVGIVAIVVACIVGAQCARNNLAFSAEPTFEDDVWPILSARCVSCHGGESKKSGLDVRRKFTLLAGGDGGPAITPGDADASLLIEKIVAKEMPPKGDDPLDEGQIALLKRWIASGAKTKRASEEPLETELKEAGPSEADRDFWLFKPVVPPYVPTVKHQGRVRTPVDAFVLAKLEEHGLGYNDDAAREVLCRRLYFALTGLPPTPDQLARFLENSSDNAYEQLVDELLASPQYGERWGRHWLDVAGYADSDGYLEADRERPNAWHYRDYVIRALNSDKPYDLFVREQIAGDEIVDWRRAPELTPAMVDSLVATGFLRTASDPTYPIYKEQPEIQKVLADTVQILSSTFFGVTVQCARCHSHKHEPITQRDYYQIQAVLHSSFDPARWLASGERTIPLATDAELARMTEGNKQIDARVAALTAQIQEIQTRSHSQWIDERLPAAYGNFDVAFADTSEAKPYDIEFAGTASGWKTEPENGRLVVRDISGKPGYATVRLTIPVMVPGEFSTTLTFGWSGTNATPETSTAMQGVSLYLRSADGKTVACQGYIDENNNKAGSPIAALNAGPDVVAENVQKLGQAVPADALANSLASAGEATVSITRDAAGQVTLTYRDGKSEQTTTGAAPTTITQIEIELRRFVLTPGATFDGLSLGRLTLNRPAAAFDDEQRLKIRDAALQPEKTRTDAHKGILAQAPTLKLTEAQVAAWMKLRHPERLTEIAQRQAAITAEQALKRSAVEIRGVLDLDDKGPESHILRRGDHLLKGKAVGPGVVAVLATTDYEYKPQPGFKTTGRRRAFAEWLTRPDHPTTARVHVNRIWAQYFGRGIIESLDDYGHLGKRPSHPELLDWLAADFVSQGWSQKRLHRHIVLSTAFRQSSATSAAKAAIDSDNQWLWAFRPRRHEGEVVRDTLLALAGKLNFQQFGEPTPVVPQPDGSIGTADNPAGNRRSIYIKVRRSQPVTILEAFDTPRMEINCNRRTEAIVATQALTLMNSPFVESQATAASARIVAATTDRAARTEYAYRLLLSRSATDTEKTRVQQFLDEFAKLTLGDNLATATSAELAVAETAAWSQIALAIVNSNEFLFVH